MAIPTVVHDEAGEDVSLLQPAVNLVAIMVPLELLAASVREALADVAHHQGVGAGGTPTGVVSVHHAREPLLDKAERRIVLHEALHQQGGGLA